MKTTLLFLSILISVSSLGQKRVKDIMKLSMGDSIGEFDNSGLTMDDRLEILMEKYDGINEESSMIDMVISREDDCEYSINYVNPEYIFFYRNNKRFTGSLELKKNECFTIIEFDNGQLDGLFYDSIVNICGDTKLFVIEGTYSKGYKDGDWKTQMKFEDDMEDYIYSKSSYWRKGELIEETELQKLKIEPK